MKARENAAKIANGGTASEACIVLENLLIGRPLWDLSGSYIRCGDSQRILNSIATKMGLKRAPMSTRGTFWILGPRGSGKTQTLAYLQSQLLEQKKHWGNRKAIVIFLDLDRTPTDDELQRKAFTHAIRTCDLPAEQAVRSIRRVSRLEYPGLLDIGIDILLTILKLGFPGAGWLLSKLLKWAAAQGARAFWMTKLYVGVLLHRRGVHAPRAVELLTHWVRYSLSPTEKKWASLKSCIDTEALSGDLFPILCKILEAANYSSVIILCDEGEALKGINLREGFKELWNRPYGNDPYPNLINLFTVVAGTSEVATLRVNPATEPDDDGFSRRFFGTVFDPAPCFKLSPPSLEKHRDNTDDFAHAKSSIEALLSGCRGVKAKELGEQDEINLRSRLLDPSRTYPATWQELWSAVGNALTP